MPIPDWIPVGVSILLPALGYAMSVSQMAKINDTKLDEYKTQQAVRWEALEKEMLLRIENLRNELIRHQENSENMDERRDDEFRDAVGQLRRVATEISSMAKEQSVINQVVNKALEGIMNRLDKHSTLMNENTQNIGLLRLLLEQKEG